MIDDRKTSLKLIKLIERSYYICSQEVLNQVISNPVFDIDEFGVLILYTAFMNGYIEIFKKLLQNGADIRYDDDMFLYYLWLQEKMIE